MVLESLFNPFVVKKKPWEMFFAGFIYAFVGLILSYLVFKESAGLLTVFLIVIAVLPMLFTTITNEEEIDLKYDGELALLKEHSKVLMFLSFMFMGVTVAFIIAYIFLPASVVKVVFSLQQNAIINVNNNIQGNMNSVELFIRIFANNLKVLFFCIVFSFLYGTGSIFILTWNASVVGAAIGNLLKSELAKGASLIGLSNVSHYFSAVSFSFFRYMLHGTFEMLAYFTAGLAGGIISIALIKHDLENDKVLTDALDLILLSLGILLLAAIVEVYITPVLFM